MCNFNEQVSYDFAAGEEKWSRASLAELTFTLADLNAVIEVQDEAARAGTPQPKLGYYMDERHVVCAELRRRRES